MTYNVPLLRKVRDHIATRPWEWNQNEWDIDLDSHLIVLAKVRDCAPWEMRDMYGLSKDKANKVLSESFNDFTCRSAYCVAGWAAYFAAPEGARVVNGVVRLADGSRRYISGYAQEALGLSDGEAGNLFAGGNTHQFVLELLDTFISRGEAELAEPA